MRLKNGKAPAFFFGNKLTRKSRAVACCSAVNSNCWNADDYFMSSSEFLAQRPQSLALPNQGPYCPRRPTLSEVISNLAQPPWTLTAFMAYLSQNQCLETLEFIMASAGYRKRYEGMIETESNSDSSPSSENCEYVRMQWQKLVDAYIEPNGPREVNLPCNVRDRLLSLPQTPLPPHPDSLKDAVQIIYELMDESVLVPFLNSVSHG